ncbi:pseudouridine synthase [Amantichitinum ursilacus]|uniref:Pseudouridine synthase n=1 Tax=Amantichitinum ursilacus TaxID=857265 RepID=A0A0N0XHR2_9NEIS|nr:pseudouridine synthase [Amantichitinum ursilacus]KPC52106.1 Ribosomal small subunit pseudouridine synthase A [Amantichitinum ursilacus]
MKQSLDRILTSQGFGTRKGVRELIADGEVAVNGQIVTDWRTDVETEGLLITLFGEEDWPYRANLYLALNKPTNYECSRKPSHHPGILTLLPEPYRWRDVQPVGRLDHDTTGLLLLSDDGAFIHAQSHPKHHQPKKYLATLAQAADESLVEQLLSGVKLHDEPAPLSALSAKQVDELHIEMVLEQGKYHQVKRMLAAAGNHCAALSRVAIGGLTLASLNLAEGEYIELDADQLAALNREGDTD